jgi:Na+-driven multidrug efflux pump
MFSSSNLILAHLVNPQEVTTFNVAKKYFDLPLTYFMIILTPFWSAITEAYIKEDFIWIKRSMKKMQTFAIYFSVLLLFMLMSSNYIFKLWVSNKVVIPYSLSILLTIYNIGILFLTPFSHFINGVGKLNLGIRVIWIKIVLFLPVSLHFSKVYGATGLLFALILINFIPNLFEILQYYKIINRTAFGIWNK